MMGDAESNSVIKTDEGNELERENQVKQENDAKSLKNAESSNSDDSSDEEDDGVEITIESTQNHTLAANEHTDKVPAVKIKSAINQSQAISKIVTTTQDPVYNNKSITEVNIFGDDKPWNRAEADITDYFNYGFNVTTWLEYCQRHKKIIQELSYPTDVIVAHLIAARDNIMKNQPTFPKSVSMRQTEIPKFDYDENLMKDLFSVIPDTEKENIRENGIGKRSEAVIDERVLSQENLHYASMILELPEEISKSFNILALSNIQLPESVSVAPLPSGHSVPTVDQNPFLEQIINYYHTYFNDDGELNLDTSFLPEDETQYPSYVIYDNESLQSDKDASSKNFSAKNKRSSRKRLDENEPRKHDDSLRRSHKSSRRSHRDKSDSKERSRRYSRPRRSTDDKRYSRSSKKRSPKRSSSRTERRRRRRRRSYSSSR